MRLPLIPLCCRRLPLALATLLILPGCDTTGPKTGPDLDGPEVVWPISRSLNPDEALIVFPYGPRNIGRYDFHAGIDIYTSRGTPAGAIMAGTARVVSESTVLVLHAGDRRSAYLHLDSIVVSDGAQVEAGEVVGLVGDVGAQDVHLHLTYMTGPKQFVDERDSRNPLKVLPPVPARAPRIRFSGDSVIVTLHAGFMTVQQIEVEYDSGLTTVLDYRQIVAQGSTARDTQLQSGIYIDASRPRRPDDDEGREFDLVLIPGDLALTIRDVALRDFDGELLLAASR